MMAPAQFVERVRGRPTVRIRGEVVHARPLWLAMSAWAALAAARLADGPLHPGAALLGLAVPCALLPLCLANPRAALGGGMQAVPRLRVVVARIAVILVALVSVSAAWAWLVVRHD